MSKVTLHSGPTVVSLRDQISGAALDPTKPLVWRRTVPLAPEFELRQGKTVFGEMEPANVADADATGECLGHSLEIRLQTSFIRGFRVESRASRGGQDGPAFRGLFFGWGRISTASGESLRWRHALSRLYDHILTDERGSELLRIRPAFLRFGRTETRIIISAPGWERVDLAELLLLTWFLRVHTEARGRRVFGTPRRRTGHACP